MTDHRLTASWTTEEPIAGMLATRQRNPSTTFFVRAHGIDHGREPIHLDQQAVTAGAAEQRMALEPAVRERCGTDRAHARGLVQQLEVFAARRALSLSAAMVADEKATARVEPKRCAAVVAVCHERIIGERWRDR